MLSNPKIWGVEDNVTTTGKHLNQSHHGVEPDTPKSLYLGGGDPQWTNSQQPWSTGSNAVADHSVSQPIMMGHRRRGSFPGTSDGNALISPRSTDTGGGLGFKMVEYVLGSSPTNKDMDSRMRMMNLNSSGGDQGVGSDGKPMAKKNDSSGKDDQNGLDDSGISKDQSNMSKLSDAASSMLSPRNDTGLGFKMVEYVLGTSPTNKDLDARMRMHHDKHKKSGTVDGKGKGLDGDGGHGQNGINGSGGLDDDQVSGKVSHGGAPFNRAPGNHLSEDELKSAYLHQPLDQATAGMNKLSLDPQSQMSVGGFSEFGIDPLQFNEYASHLIDSPGMLDYNGQQQQMYQQHPQQQQQRSSGSNGQPPMMPHHATPGQGYPPGGQQQPPNQAAFPQNPYYQDPFAAQMGHLIPAGPPPAMMANPYYGMPPWGMYPPNAPMQATGPQPGGPPPHLTQQQQAAMMARNSQGRPLTPTGSNDGTAGHNGGQMPSGQYPLMPPHGGYYDQNGMAMMGQQARMNPAMLRMPPMMMNQQQGMGRAMMGPNGQQQSQNGAGPMFSSNSNGNPGSGYGPNGSSNMYAQHANNGAGSLTNGNAMGFGQMQPTHNGNYGSSGLGPIGSMGQSGLGNGSPRRDSFDGHIHRRDSLSGMFGSGGSLDGAGQFSRNHNHKGSQNQYYPMGSGLPSASPGPIGMLPSQSPPPGSGMNGLGLGGLSQGRLSAAPGAEGKYLGRNTGSMSSSGRGGAFGVPSNNIDFPHQRLLQRNSSIDKSTGRSRLLEDFRNNRHPTLQLRDLTDHIVEFSQDQHGSRFIQQKLERATPNEKQLVFNEIIGSAYNLMTDVFGNYVIQKFFEFGSPEQKQSLAMKVKGHVLPLALQMYGCRVIQKALESIPPDQQKEIVKELDGHVLKCVKDQNGNHVVQKCIECVDPHALQFIIGAFQNQVFALSTHPYGCRVIQRILEHCTPEQTSPILEELHSNTEQLVQDQYGNYVIQHVLEHGRPEDKSKLIQSVRGKVLTLSQHKFASNVVEKCVCHATRQERAFLIDEVCAYGDNSSHSALYTMMKDQYANYVVQKMIEVAEPPQRKALLQRIRPQVTALRKYTYGKHILAKLEKYIMKNAGDLGPIGAPPPSQTNGNI